MKRYDITVNCIYVTLSYEIMLNNIFISGRYFRDFKLSSLESKLSIETRESRRESRLSKFSKFSITNIVK